MDEPVAVEAQRAHYREHHLDHPETHHDFAFRPSAQFEMMMDGRHLEHALVPRVEHGNLDDVAHGLDDEQATDNDGKQLRVRGDGQRGEKTAQGEGSGVAHEDERRVRVVPQEPEACGEGAACDDRKVAGVAHRIGHASLRSHGRQVLRLPERDESVGDEGDHGIACAQAIESVPRPCPGLRKR